MALITNPQTRFLKDYASVTRTAGDVTLNATAITAVQTSLDLTLTAATGDVIEFGWSGVTGTEAQVVSFDVYTMVGGAGVNPFGPGLSASMASLQGVAGWLIDNIAQNFNLGVPVTRTLVSGDIDAGTVVLRLFYAKANTTARTLFAQTNIPLTAWAKNYGPAT